MNPDVALKPDSRERFLREARSAAALTHDHIVPIYQVDEQNGVPFIAMPFLMGEPLDVRLKREKPLPIADAVRIARETAEGLAAAYAVGLIHRDIKPGNLWLEERPGQAPRVRILDFGLARGPSDDACLTMSGVILGTPAYMAPEQARSEKVDHRADLFSFGVVLYEMTTGHRPFSGRDAMAALSALLTEQPQPANKVNPAVPADLSALIKRLLNKSPDDRPATAAEVVSALREIENRVLSGATAVAPTVSPAPARRWQRWAIAAGAAVVALALAIWSFLTGRKQKHGSRLRWHRRSLAAGTVVVAIALTVWSLTGHRKPDPVPDPVPVNKIPASEPLRIKAIELNLFQKINDMEFKPVGKLGVGPDGSYTPLLYDRVRVEVRLSRPGYAYLLAFRPDGNMDVFLPSDKNEPPQPTDTVVYDPTDKRGAYALDEGVGLWVFAVVASEKPLPPFNEWRKNLGEAVPWKPTAARDGTVWYDDGVWSIESRTSAGVQINDRGPGAKLPGPEQNIEVITDWLRTAGTADVVKVAAMGFGVGPREK
jgi:hypothetical protein